MNTFAKYKVPILVLAASIVIAAGLITYAVVPHAKHTVTLNVSVEKRDLSQEVRATGTVKAAQEISLSFERSGRIVSSNVQVGSKVSQGQVLASVTSADLAVQQTQAEANLSREQLRLNRLTSATSSSTAVYSDIQTSINNNRISISDKLSDASIKVDSILSATVDKFYQNPRTNPSFGTITQGSQFYVFAPTDVSMNLNNDRSNVSTQFALTDQLHNALLSATSTEADLTAATLAGEKLLQLTQKLLTDLAAAVNMYGSRDASAQTTIAGYRAEILSSQTTIDTALLNLRTSEQQYAAAQSTASPYEIELQQNAVVNAQAAVDAINVQIAKGSIRAPIAGVITQQDAKVGQTATQGTPVISMISNGKYQVELYVSEADISSIKVGQSAKVTFDGTPTLERDATVITVDPAPTITNGSSSYKVTLQFATEDDTIKPGMTANVRILIGAKAGVLAVPKDAIIQRNTDQFVLKIVNGQTVEQKVTTGLSGSNGYVEIVSGLTEGDVITTFGNN